MDQITSPSTKKQRRPIDRRPDRQAHNQTGGSCNVQVVKRTQADSSSGSKVFQQPKHYKKNAKAAVLTPLLPHSLSQQLKGEKPCMHPSDQYRPQTIYTHYQTYTHTYIHAHIHTHISTHLSAGLMQAIMSVCELPPRLPCSSLVSFESRYGTCPPPLPPRPSARAEMTFPRANSPLLMLMPSRSLLPYIQKKTCTYSTRTRTHTHTSPRDMPHIV